MTVFYFVVLFSDFDLIVDDSLIHSTKRVKLESTFTENDLASDTRSSCISPSASSHFSVASLFDSFRVSPSIEIVLLENFVNPQIASLCHQIRPTMENDEKLTAALLWKWNQSKSLQPIICNNAEQFKQQCQCIYQQLQTPQQFKPFYQSVFKMIKQAQNNTGKTVDLRVACQFLKLLLQQQFPHHVHSFCSYLEYLLDFPVSSVSSSSSSCPSHSFPSRRFTFDHWNSFYEWCLTVEHGSFIGWEQDGAWPVLFDEYVEWIRRDQGNDCQDVPENEVETESVISPEPDLILSPSIVQREISTTSSSSLVSCDHIRNDAVDNTSIAESNSNLITQLVNPSQQFSSTVNMWPIASSFPSITASSSSSSSSSSSHFSSLCSFPNSFTIPHVAPLNSPP